MSAIKCTHPRTTFPAVPLQKRHSLLSLMVPPQHLLLQLLPVVSARSIRSGSSTAAKGFTGKCLFCDGGPESRRDKKNRRKFEKLSYSMTKQTGETVRKVAEIRGDEKIALLTRNTTDFVALEICYHETCRSEYTHKHKLDAIKAKRAQNSTADDLAEDSDVYDLAFKNLADIVHSRLLLGNEVIRLTTLRQLYNDCLVDLGAEIIRGNYRGDKLKRRL